MPSAGRRGAKLCGAVIGRTVGSKNVIFSNKRREEINWQKDMGVMNIGKCRRCKVREM